MIKKRTKPINLPSLSLSSERLTSFEVDDSYWPSPAGVIVPKFRGRLKGVTYAEPCAGNGALIKHMQGFASCVFASDIATRHPSVVERDCFDLDITDLRCRTVVTNPPFSSKFTYAFLDHFLHLGADVWMMMPFEWASRSTTAHVLPFCERILAIGQLKWIEDSQYKGHTHFAWFKFVPKRVNTLFEGLTPVYNSSKVPDRLKGKL